jgi:hypothetical protein
MIKLIMPHVKKKAVQHTLLEPILNRTHMRRAIGRRLDINNRAFF